MSIVAPVTVAWQRVTNANTGEEKEIETFTQLEDAILRARDVILAAESGQDPNFTGNDPEAHITLHPGEYQYGNSLSQQQLNNIYITILPGAIVTDASSTFPADATENIADLNSFASKVFFASQQQEFIFDSVVRFRENVIFEENSFISSVTGGEDIDVTSTNGDITVDHADTGGGVDDNDTSTFLNQIEFDDNGHVEFVGFDVVDTLDADDFVSVSGDTMSGSLTVNQDVNVQQDLSVGGNIVGTAAFRDLFVDSNAPTSSDGDSGDVWLETGTQIITNVNSGPGISTSRTNGDVTVSHGNTGGATDNSDSTTAVTEISFDAFGHVESITNTTVSSGLELEDDTVSVITGTENINFASNLAVSDDGDGSSTVTIPGTDDFSISDLGSLLPSGQTLSEIGGTDGVEGKLSSDISGASKNDTFVTSTNTEKGIVGTTGVSLTGPLNPQVQNTDQYNADTFSQASTGVLRFIVNGSDLLTIDLTSTDNAITNTTGNGSELSVSSASPLTFANGDQFNDVKQRTGSWTLVQGDMTSGLNTVRVRHEESGGALIGESQTIRYFLDDDTSDITFSNRAITNLNLDATKQLSGVSYNTGGDVDFSIDADNVYRNTYSSSSTAISFDTTNISLSSQAIPSLGATEGVGTQINLVETATISADRIIGDSVTARATIEDPVDAGEPYTSAEASSFQLLIDQVSNPNAALLHQYNNERYRAAPNADFDTDLGTGGYDSSISIVDGSGNGYGDELQVTEGKIVYPSIDYSSFADGPTNPDYSTNTSGQRTYYGIFTNSAAVSNWVLEISGTATLVSQGNVTSATDEVSISIRIPTQTGWMDINEDFVTGNTADGDGAYQETNANNPSKTIGANSEIGLTTGTKVTSDGFDNLYYRITAPDDWTGEITEMDITWGVS